MEYPAYGNCEEEDAGTFQPEGIPEINREDSRQSHNGQNRRCSSEGEAPSGNLRLGGARFHFLVNVKHVHRYQRERASVTGLEL